MSVRAAGRNSAAFLILALSLTFFVGALLITLLAPYMNPLLDSQLFTFDTQWGTDLGNWVTTYWDWIGFLVLIGILYSGYINSRRPV